jgi:Ca2+-binding RTX toxin-like protein
MPTTQPEGAIRTLAAGTYADAIFSTDGSKLYAVSGNSVSVINVATGATIGTYTIGTQLGALDISPDGRYLAIVEEQPGGGTGILYRVDLTNGSVSTYGLPGTSALHDVGFLADGSIVVSQETSAPLRVVDLDTGGYWEASGPIRANATIAVSADGTYIIAQAAALDWPLYAFDTEVGTGYAIYYDPYAGASVGGPASAVGAVSPDGSMVVQGMTLKVYEGDFSSSISLSGIHPDLYNPAALAFSPDGSKLYVLVASVDKVFVLDTGNWQLLESYPIEADALHPGEWSPGSLTPGEMMRVSDDGDFLSIITPAGIQVVDLNLVIEPTYDGGSGDDTIVGSGGADTITGSGGNDTLSGIGGNDTISGGIGNDTLMGGAGNDILTGDDGNDWLSGGSGNDTLTGGAGADAFYFFAVQSNVDHITDLSSGDTIELETAFFTALQSGTLSASAFHQGSAASTADQRIIYNSSTGQIFYDADGTGAAGQLFLFATVNPGTVISASTFAAVTRAGTVESGVSYSLADDEVNLVLTGSAPTTGTGNELNNQITGNSAGNQFNGLAGNDTLIGNGGNDYLDGGLGADTMTGGTGDDTYIVDNFDDKITELAGEGTDTVVSSRDIFLRSNFENATLTGFAQNAGGNELANILTGNDGINVLAGDGGNDTLIGNAGNDSLQGGAGDDLLDGGDGNDSATYDAASSAVTVSLAISGAQNTGGAGIDTLISIEILGGSSYNDRLTASASGNSLFGWFGDDFLFGGTGVDSLDGGGGNDVYVISSAAHHSTAEIVDRGFDEGAIDEVRFSATSASTLTMFAGDTGIERIVIGTGTGATAITTGLLAHNVDASALGYAVAIVGNDGANRLTGGAGGDELEGKAGDDLLYGRIGDDTLTGGLGYDRMYGGLGDDTYVVNDASDYAYENVGEGTDQVIASLDYQLRVNVENLTLVGTAVTGKGNELNNVITGNGGANYLYGYGGNDDLNGGGGDDYLIGDIGDDTLTGGAGFDRMYGGAGDDTYIVGDADDYAYENIGQGHDTVIASIDHQLRAEVEDLALTGSALIGKGNALDNGITGNANGNKLYGYEGNDALDGQGGDDYLFGGNGNDQLDGGTGYDRLYGGAGDDRYIVNDTTDFAYENAGEGNDRVYASINHILRANIEELELAGSANLNGYGNSQDNLLFGNSGANILYGRDGSDKLYGEDGADVLKGENGNDWLEGGSGRDRFYGGAGADDFVFRGGDFAGLTSSTCDQVHDFSQADGDRIRLNLVDANTGLAGDQAFAFIGSGAFTGVAGQLRYQQISGQTYVQGDTDGDGQADFWIRLDGLHALAAGDFVL